MVDRKTRRQLAETIRHLVSGRITNDEFEGRIPVSSGPAIQALFWNGAWRLYDDLREYNLEERDRVADEDRRVIARWVLFLKSDFEYEGPYQLLSNVS